VFRRRTAAKHFAAIVVVATLSPAVSAFSENTATPRLFEVLQAEFAKRNPRATEVTLLGLVPYIEYRPRAGFVALARGIRPDHQFEGSFEDELFGVFLVDHNLSQVTQALKFIPSPRWYDYSFRIERIVHSPLPRRLILVGAGSTYGDHPKRLEIVLPDL
jgi:hypothetical protein